MEDRIILALRQIVHAVDRHSKSLIRDFGMTGPQLAILQEIAKHDSVASGELAKSVFVGPGTVTGILDRLERDGLVERTRATDDRRKVTVSITRKGKAKLQERQPSLLRDKFRSNLRRLSVPKRKRILDAVRELAEMMNDSEEVDSKTEE